jgi:hypothetical protein
MKHPGSIRKGGSFCVTNVVAIVLDDAVVVERVIVAAEQTNTSAIRRYLPIRIGRS